MEQTPQPPLNFHELSERRKSLRRGKRELGNEPEIFETHYKEPLETAGAEAVTFKVGTFGGLKGAKEVLRKQKAEYEKAILKENDQIDDDFIGKEMPEVVNVLEIMRHIAHLKNFRMRRMFEILNPRTSRETKTRDEALLKTIQTEIEERKKALEKMDPLVLRQAELIQYKKDLSQSGHICITPNVEKDLEAIGERMLTGKPMFLHGPTGTGKTSLARFAATHFTGKNPEMIFCNPQTRESNVWGKTGIKPTKDGAIETVEIYGPLARAMKDGKIVIFDEFTALPKEQMVFIKGVFNLQFPAVLPQGFLQGKV